MTRIISGRFRGKHIKAPARLDVRPTTDFAKESLFNILNNQFYFDEIRALDLFAGIGNLSLELASRGCPEITCVDSNPHCIRHIQKMAEEMDIDALRCIRNEALHHIEREFESYELILADPPYDYEEYETLVNAIFERKLLKEDGVLVLEHSARRDLSHLAHFQRFRKYGKVGFSFFELPAAG